MLSLELFERTWARGEYWAMMALDPRELPVTTPIDELVDATAALERVDAGAARRAYTAITQRAPDAFGAWMGLGNSAYATGDPQSAAAAFARAADLQPLRADAWNNLASARLAIGDFAGAQEAVERAIGIGGEHRDVYERTAQEIAAGRTRQ